MTDVLTVCVPSPGTVLSRHLVPGSAMVTCASVDGNGRVEGERALVYYEGNVYGATNLTTFRDKLSCAAGRLMTRYPTIAWISAETSDLLPVGSYDYARHGLRIDRPDLVRDWEEQTGGYAP